VVTVTITLPWPPAATSANASGQGKWRGKAEAAKSYKSTCAWTIRAAKVQPVAFSPVSVVVVFNPPSRTARYDLDNLLGRAKQGLDAIAEAIGVDDADWQEMRLLRGVKGGAGSIVVTVERCAPIAVSVPFRGGIT
jgi:crossover junction endodeoxyribonuclease RusA